MGLKLFPLITKTTIDQVYDTARRGGGRFCFQKQVVILKDSALFLKNAPQFYGFTSQTNLERF